MAGPNNPKQIWCNLITHPNTNQKYQPLVDICRTCQI